MMPIVTQHPADGSQALAERPEADQPHRPEPALLPTPFVVAAFVVAVAASGALAVHKPALALAAPFALLLVVGLVRRLDLAAMLVIAAAPFDRYLNLYVNPNAFKALGVLLLLSFVVNRARGTTARRQPLSAAIAVFLVLVLVSAVVNANGAEGLQTVLRYLSFGLTALVLVSVLQKELRPGVAAATYAYAATVAAVFTLFNFLSGGSVRGSGPILDPNDLAYVLVAALPLVLWLAGQRRPVLHYVCAAILVAGTASTLSRGGAIAAGAMLAFAVWRGRVPTGAVVGGLLALVIAVPIVTTLYSGVLDTALQQKSYIASANVDSRTLRWHAALVMTWEHPLTGVGPAGFRQNYLVVSDHVEPTEVSPVSHDMYLEVSSELGVPGLVAFVSVLGLAWTAAGRARRTSTGPAASLTDAVQISLLGALVASVFLTEQYYTTLWFLLAMCAGLAGRAETARELDAEAVAG